MKIPDETLTKIEDVRSRDPRYRFEAYVFLLEALQKTSKRNARTEGVRHITGRELLDGIRDLAKNRFGYLARTVFRVWGLERTDDFGEIVFNLVDAELLAKNADDSKAEFVGVYDFAATFEQSFLH